MFYNCDDDTDEEIEIPKSRFTNNDILIFMIKKKKINIYEILEEMNKEQKDREKNCKIHDYININNNK
jgi:hypothetical protein